MKNIFKTSSDYIQFFVQPEKKIHDSKWKKS